MTGPTRLTAEERETLQERIAGILALPDDLGLTIPAALLELVEAILTAHRADAWDEGYTTGSRAWAEREALAGGAG